MLMRNKKVAAIAALSVLPVAVEAQDFTGAATLGYGSSSVDGNGDFSSLTFDGIVDADFGNGLSGGMGLSLARIDPDAVAEDTEINTFELDVMYTFANGFGVGAYYDRGRISEDLGLAGLTSEGKVESIGLQAGYALNDIEVLAFFGKSETDPDLPSGVDWKDLGASVQYAPSSDLIVGGHLMRSTIDGPGGDVDLDSFGLGGAYAFGNGWMGFAGVQRASLDDIGLDATTFGAGVAYDLSNITSVSVIASLELARTKLDDGASSLDVDTVKLGFTIPLGVKAVTSPLNSVANSAIAPNRNALTSTIKASF